MSKQIDLLANYIMTEIPGEPSKSEGAGECAIRIMQNYRHAFNAIIHELGVPGADYPAPVSNAYYIAWASLYGVTAPTEYTAKL